MAPPDAPVLSNQLTCRPTPRWSISRCAGIRPTPATSAAMRRARLPIAASLTDRSSGRGVNRRHGRIAADSIARGAARIALAWFEHIDCVSDMRLNALCAAGRRLGDHRAPVAPTDIRRAGHRLLALLFREKNQGSPSARSAFIPGARRARCAGAALHPASKETGET